MAAYAHGTKVPVPRSVTEIRKIMHRFGAEGFAYGENPDSAVMMFRKNGRHIKFTLPLGNCSDAEVRRRWRCLVLVIKSKLTAVDTGIVSFEDEFLAQTVLPDGQTVGQAVASDLALAYRTGKMPPLLEHLGGA